MSYHKIPEGHVARCDRCGYRQSGKALMPYEAKLRLSRNALDFQGQPVAPDNVEADLCLWCMEDVWPAVLELLGKEAASDD